MDSTLHTFIAAQHIQALMDRELAERTAREVKRGRQRGRRWLRRAPATAPAASLASPSPRTSTALGKSMCPLRGPARGR
jgi:hypothetical protein